MANSVIQVSNLSKSYRLGVIGSRTISEDLNRWWAKLRKQPDPYLRIGQEDLSNRIGERIWALKDINFEVQQGEVLGIIGRNGAGKSTLLKILSRVTAPTTGEVRVKGRIASLLEVGTGFHPELTGRENVFLNGAILGMKREEIERKFEEIVDFSGVEKFIDTPVKRYSSGMYVRLAFAVAAHLEPEILIVDEVLAVGDAEFQKKCLGKMGEVAGEGRTVLFVSHNMGAIQQLCPKTILLNNGTIIERGKSEYVISIYLSSLVPNTNAIINFSKPDDFDTWIESATILCNGIAAPVMKYGDSLSLEVNCRSIEPLSKPSIGFVIYSSRGIPVVNSNNLYLPSSQFSPGVNTGTIKCNLGRITLMEDHYSLTLYFGKNEQSKHQNLQNILSFEVIENDAWGTGKLPTRKISSLWWPTDFTYHNNQ